jgi:hypothetical protein
LIVALVALMLFAAAPKANATVPQHCTADGICLIGAVSVKPPPKPPQHCTADGICLIGAVSVKPPTT